MSVKTMLVFDPVLWGGRDVGDNSQFWKPADVLSVEGHGMDQTATVQFLHDGRISAGHFTYVKPLPKRATA